MSSEISYYGELFAGNKVTPAIQRAANTAKTFGLALVKARTPVDTGQLKDSWKATIEGNGIRWENEAPYAGYVELGTRRMKPRYMLTNSLVDINLVFQEELSKELGRSIGSQVLNDLVGTPSQPTRGSLQDSKVRPGNLPKSGFTPRGILSKSQKEAIKTARPLWQAKPYRPNQVGVVRY